LLSGIEMEQRCAKRLPLAASFEVGKSDADINYNSFSASACGLSGSFNRKNAIGPVHCSASVQLLERSKCCGLFPKFALLFRNLTRIRILD